MLSHLELIPSPKITIQIMCIFIIIINNNTIDCYTA